MQFSLPKRCVDHGGSDSSRISRYLLFQSEKIIVCNTFVLEIQWLKVGMVVYIGSVNFSYMYAYFYKATRKES